MRWHSRLEDEASRLLEASVSPSVNDEVATTALQALDEHVRCEAAIMAEVNDGSTDGSRRLARPS
jgi:hypothetical protein